MVPREFAPSFFLYSHKYKVQSILTCKFLVISYDPFMVRCEAVERKAPLPCLMMPATNQSTSARALQLA